MSNAEIVKRRIRSKDFSRPFNTTLGLRLIDLEGIKLHLSILTAMGESTQEFDSFVPSLLLEQLSDLHSAFDKENDQKRKENLLGIIFDTRQLLWPLKN